MSDAKAPGVTATSPPAARESLKSSRIASNWKDKLRQHCFRRIREERSHLLWRLRSGDHQTSTDKKEIVESACRDIITDALQKIKKSPADNCTRMSSSEIDDLLWEYDDSHTEHSAEIGSEDILIEMERLLYEELRQEMMRRELEAYEEEDEYLAQAVFEHMRLENTQNGKNGELWCPICKQGELKEAYHLIYCTSCNLRLDLENDKVNLEFLRKRLGEVHVEHIERGCKAAPTFCVETVFDLTALYIQCISCETFEIVI